MFTIKTPVIVLTAVIGLIHSETQSQNKTMNKMNNQEKAAAINKAVQGTDFKAIEQLVTEGYIQHTPVVPDGRKGLLGLLSKIEYKEIPAPQIKNVRSFEDGEYVVLHHDVNWPNRKAMFEIFRFQDGLAAEHWSGIMDHPEKTVNGHSMVDGETMVKDRSRTKENKEFARAFVETILIQGKFDRILEYYHPEIIQHNPFIDNTVPGLVKGIEELQKKGIGIQIEKIHRVLGEGNFVLVLSEGKFAGKPTAFFDLFRVEKDKIVEHWDVLQEIPGKMLHTNGMF
jgi:predicted SnoaL-like aldol condensation-catalyzing enzyme